MLLSCISFPQRPPRSKDAWRDAAKAAGVVDCILARDDFISVTDLVPALGKARVDIILQMMRFAQRIIYAFEASLRAVKTMPATRRSRRPPCPC